MKTTRILAVAVVAGLVNAAPLALAQADRGEEGNAARIATSFARLAGSDENALALVNALRNGQRVVLVSDTGGTKTPVTTTFELPGGPMDWDNVVISLALARDSLDRAGIKYPDPEQLEAALVGGEVATVKGKVRLTGALLK